ncbi:hypothetical protein F442_03828 [Phytophthora nicotianae P10297]|uniref:Uncharacterized protein n=2 Tax=Phytophthora nicotianae TaxID=4792 RepID=W2ZV97_PHYNI|nr:hypothetical protein L914_05386 [Phytophthora nicotianae]ETP50955.1 hypothetical protein F442_03828 [Phytophthora nicotianae P10297]
MTMEALEMLTRAKLVRLGQGISEPAEVRPIDLPNNNVQYQLLHGVVQFFECLRNPCYPRALCVSFGSTDVLEGLPLGLLAWNDTSSRQRFH